MVLTGFASAVSGNVASALQNLPSHEVIVFDIAAILVISAVFAFFARMLKQPLIPAYVLAGLLVGPVVFGFVTDLSIVLAFSEIGIAFLLFVAGLELSFEKLKEASLGRIIFAGFLQVLAIFVLTVMIGKYISLTYAQSLYFGIILAFSSTMVVVKSLADRDELVTLHGRLVLGILLLQDLIALVAVVVIMSGGLDVVSIGTALLRLVGVIAVAVILQLFVLERMFRFAAKSGELLLLSALAVLFLFVVLSILSGTSIIIGAFIAGVLLANSPFKLEMKSQMGSLGNFFAIMFFVALGMQLSFAGISWARFLVVLAMTLLAKPLVTLFFLRAGRYTHRTSFFASVSLAQLSEFSLILGMLALNAGVFDAPLFSTIVLTTIITMSVTPQIINYKSQIYKRLGFLSRIFDFLPTRESLDFTGEKIEKKILLFGGHRMGRVILKDLMPHKKDLLVVDHNPEVIVLLKNKGIPCIYGDLTNAEILEKIDTRKLELVISTIPSSEGNLFLLKNIKSRNSKVAVILTASGITESLEFYKKGADYVILPKVVAGTDLMHVIKQSKRDFSRMKQEHVAKLRYFHDVLR